MTSLYKVILWIAVWVFLCLSMGFMLGYWYYSYHLDSSLKALITVPCDVSVKVSPVEIHEFRGTVKAEYIKNLID